MRNSDLQQAVQAMSDLPDISGGDSPELRRLCDQSAREVKLIGCVSASILLEMIAHMRQLEALLRGTSDDYVAWCRYVYDDTGGIQTIVTCDSDAKGAFKVYRATCSEPPSRLKDGVAEGQQDWCDHCSGDLNGIKHILCDRCYGDFTQKINTREMLRGRILDWLAHRCDRSPICGNCIYCRVAQFVQAIEDTAPTESSERCTEQGTFTHRGQRYDLALLILLVTGRESVLLKVSDLRSVPQNVVLDGHPCASCKHGPPSWHEQRIADANLLVPLLVHVDMTVLDGLHRLEKASRRHQRLIPSVQITDADLSKCVFPASTEQAAERPKIICLCGSTRFIELFAIKTWELEREGNIVLGCTLLPMWYCKVTDHFGEATGTKEQCDELHLRKIDLADEVLVLDVDGYIGSSTKREIEYSTAAGKPIRYLSQEFTTAPAPVAQPEADPVDDHCKCGLDKDDPIHSFSTEWQQMHRFEPRANSPATAAVEAAREIRGEFKRKFVIPTESDLVAILSRYFPIAEQAAAPSWLISQIKRRLQTVLDCPNGMCSHCVDVLCEDVMPMVDRAIELCTQSSTEAGEGNKGDLGP